MKVLCVTHYGGCAILFNKETFHSDIKVTSVYLHDTRDRQQNDVKEGESGWVPAGCHIKGIVSAAAAQRQIFLHNDVITHQQPICQEARYREEVAPYNPRCDAGGACGLGCWDFDGAAWRRPCGNDRKPTSIIAEAFADTDLPMPLGPTPLWGPGAVPGEWADVCGFLKPPDSHEKWKVRLHGAFSKGSKLPP